MEPLEGRTLLNGSLDPTFGRPDLPGRGTATVPQLAEVTGMAVLPDGGAVLVGTVSRSGNDDFAAIRFGPNGQVDTSFGTMGLATMAFDLGPLPAQSDRARGVTVQPDGKILLVGQVERLGGQFDFGIVRLLPNGQPDPLFGPSGEGRVVVGFDRGAIPSEQDDVARGVTVQPDGKILVVGSVDDRGDKNDFGIVRLDPDGSLDPTFGEGGRRVVGFDLGVTAADQDDDPVAVVVQPDGRILVTGSVDRADRQRDFGIVRLTSDGNLDPSFGQGGRAVWGFDLGSRPSRQHDDPAAIILQPDGKIVVAGTVLLDDGLSHFGVLRLLANGTPDPSFGQSGKVSVNVGSGARDIAAALTLQPDGRLLVSGEAQDVRGDSNFGVIQLDTSGNVERTFGSDGRAILRFDLGPRPFDHDIARGAGLDAEGRLVIAGQVDSGSGHWLAGVARIIVDARPPSVVQIGPVLPNPRNGPVTAIDVQFSEPIDPATFSSSALQLTRNGQQVPLGTGVSIDPLPGLGTTFRIRGLGPLTEAEGAYLLTVSASGVVDLSGNQGVGTFAAGFSVDLTPPKLIRVGPIPSLFRNDLLGPVEVQFSEPIDPLSLQSSALRLSRNGHAIPIGPGVRFSAVPGSATTFHIHGLSELTAITGVYELRVDASGVRDFAGNSGRGVISTSFLARRKAVPADYDGDGISDVSTFTIVNGVGRFDIRQSTDGRMRVESLGGPGDFPVDADYDGDGIIDPAVFGYDPNLGYSRFLARQSSDGQLRMIPFGGPFDFPVAGDFDGDGKTDIAVYGYSPLEGFSRFGVLLSSNGQAFSLPFGGPFDFPIIGDFDGDGRDDIAVFGYSPDDGFSRFAILPSGTNDLTFSQAIGGYPVPFGGRFDSPVAADFDGDGITDLALYGYSPLNGFSRFGILLSSGRPTITFPFGGEGDVPVPGDFDGDGKTEIAVFGDSPNKGYPRFAILPSGGAPARSERFGAITSVGLPAFPVLFPLAGSPTTAGSIASAALLASPPDLSGEAGPGPTTPDPSESREDRRRVRRPLLDLLASNRAARIR